MTESDMNIVPHEGTTVDAVSPRDSKAWELVLKVTEYMHDNALYNYSETFRVLGVCKQSFYNAFAVPFVQDQLLRRYRKQDAAELQLISTSWFPIVRYQMELARGEHGARDAASASRFIKDRLETLEERIEVPETPESEQEAAIILARFKEVDKKKIKATRTTVTETIEG